MAFGIIDTSTLTAIANAIRAKLGVQTTYKPSEMATAIGQISSGITPTGTKEITANGTNIDVASYAYADVAVPNSYAAGDEGKVVSNGALVSQSSSSVTTNGTVNTTLIDSLTVAVPASAVDSGTKSITANGSNQDVVGYAAVDVAVPNSYSQNDEGKVVSNGALVAQTSDTVTTNDTYDTTLINSLTVNVSGGVSITDGIVITEWDTAGTRPKAVEIYGNVPNYMFGQYNNAYSLGINLTSVTFHNTEIIGYGAFQRAGLSSITIPDSVNSIGEQCFRGQTALAHYVHENARDLYGYNKPAVKALNYGLSHLEDMQLGAMGKPVTALYKNAFANNQVPSTAVFTIYTTGNNVNTILAGMRVYLTTQQIVFKASESTTYNGNSYSAGDTMLTSTPS